MDFIWDSIKDFLKEIINANLTNMFTDVNNNVSTIAVEVGTTPQGWNGDSGKSCVNSIKTNLLGENYGRNNFYQGGFST